MFKTSIITLRESTTAEPHVNFFQKTLSQRQAFRN